MYCNVIERLDEGTQRSSSFAEFLERIDNRRQDWPVCSSDIYPIEQVWGVLGRRLAERRPPPEIITEKCVKITQEILHNLTMSVKRGRILCISARVHHYPLNILLFFGLKYKKRVVSVFCPALLVNHFLNKCIMYTLHFFICLLS